MRSHEVVLEVTVRGERYRVHGTQHPAYPGQSGGKGERRLSPDEPAFCEIDKVIDLSDGQEVDLSQVSDHFELALEEAIQEEVEGEEIAAAEAAWEARMESRWND